MAARVAIVGRRGGGGAVASARPPLGLAAGSSSLWLARHSLCLGSSSPFLWGAFRHDGGVGRPTGKTQVAKARLFPVRSHRLGSTWRPTGGATNHGGKGFRAKVITLSDVVTLLRALLRFPSSLGKELWRRDPREGVVLESCAMVLLLA
uniref:Uncharacterized protein n=1 Tax=Oryza rufipogon TaxID=4529 RepID=A0A0E0PQH9_ORYRU